jgi:hypothetical protein
VYNCFVNCSYRFYIALLGFEHEQLLGFEHEASIRDGGKLLTSSENISPEACG